MRKQDRITQQQREDPSKRQPDKPQPTSGEQIKGSAQESNRPPRKPGPLPLPD